MAPTHELALQITEVINKITATLSPSDHPYLNGAWKPLHEEVNATDMEVFGEIPKDLSGVYIRNTENPLFEPIKRYHPFDGDGMLHSISFGNGEARYAIGIDRYMWGSDYPHDEGTFPYTHEHLRQVMGHLRPEQIQQILSGTAAEIFKFDLAALQPAADVYGPTVAEVATPVNRAVVSLIGIQ